MNMAVLDQQTYPQAMTFQAVLPGHARPAFESHPQRGVHLYQERVQRSEAHAVDSVEKAGLAPWLERKAKRILESGCQDKLSIAQVAAQCALSRSHFSRAFKKTTGLSPQEWMLNARIRRAQQLISEGALSMCEVAFECGFSDQSHFTRTFSKVAGASPKRWQRSQQAELEVA